MIPEIVSLVGKIGQAEIDKDDKAKTYYKNMLAALINQRVNDLNCEIKDMYAVRVLLNIIIPDEQQKTEIKPVTETKAVQDKPKKKVGRKRKVKASEAAPTQIKQSESVVVDDGEVKKDLAKGNPWKQQQ